MRMSTISWKRCRASVESTARHGAKVRYYVELFRRDYEEILKVRPGLTDLASLKYRDEAALLGKAANPEDEYRTRVLPDKIRLAKDYLRRSSFLFDLGLILKTLFKLFDYRMSS